MSESKIKRLLSNKPLLFSIKLMMSTLILYVVVRNVDWTITYSLLKDADLLLLVACIGILFVLLYLRALRWQVIAQSFKASISLKESYYQNIIAVAFANATPARIGEAIKIKFLKDTSGISYFRAALIAIFEKCMDALAILFSLLLGLIFILKGQTYWLLPWCIFVVYVVLLAISVSALKQVLTLAFSIAKRFKKHIDPLSISRKNYAAILGISLASWIILAFQTYLISESLNAEISIAVFIFLVPMMALSGLIPFSLGGIGIRDAVSVFLLARLGSALEQAVLISVLYTFINYLIPVLIGAYLYMAGKGKRNYFL